MRTVAAALALSMLLVACRDDSANQPQATHAPRASEPQPAPGAAPSTDPQSGITYFEGSYDASTKELTFRILQADGTLKPEINLPEGTAANNVQVKTVPGSVFWQGVCGTNTLCGTVYLSSTYSVAIQNIKSVTDSITPSTVTQNVNPIVWAGVSANGQTGTQTLAFNDVGGGNFTFKGHVTGDLVLSDAGGPANANASGGNVSHSSKYTLMGTLGQGPAANNASESSKYKLRGGVVGASQKP